MGNDSSTVEAEIKNVSAERPHLLLLGAGASKAALPNGDQNGRLVPLLRDVAEELRLVEYFPDELKQTALSDFEAAYSRLFDRGASPELEEIDSQVRNFFMDLELPDEPNLYDVINLSLREKDAIATFNWDPFLIQSQVRLLQHGITTKLPQLFFLHGNVLVGFCEQCGRKGVKMGTCPVCGGLFKSVELLYPVEHKDYQSNAFIQREWEGVRVWLENCLTFTVFGYSAPVTDREAIDLLKGGWGKTSDREIEQTEIINRPGADRAQLRETWDPFIHTHHYEVLDSFYDSSIARHPRRSVEAFTTRYLGAQFTDDNPVPRSFATLDEMAEWYRPLLEAE